MSRILMVVMIRNLLHVLIHHDDPSHISETKKISRVESLKNLILHGKTEPDLPPEVFNIPHGCSCRWAWSSQSELVFFVILVIFIQSIISRHGSHLRQSGRRSKSSERPTGRESSSNLALNYLEIFLKKNNLQRPLWLLSLATQLFFLHKTHLGSNKKWQEHNCGEIDVQNIEDCKNVHGTHLQATQTQFELGKPQPSNQIIFHD